MRTASHSLSQLKMKSSARSNDSPSDLHGHPEQDHELLLLEPIRAAEVLEFFDDLGVFSELEADPSANIAILRYRDAPVSVDHGYVTPSASAPQFQSFSAMLDSSEIPAFDEDTGALGPMESLLQLHVHEADFSALSIEAASDSLALKQELQYFTNSDGYDSEPSSFASEPATPPPAGEADTETDVALRPTKKTKKKKKSTSQRQKEELSYLRGKLFEYENELKRIAMENKDRVSSGANEANESNETQPNDVSGQTPATSEADAIAVRVKSLSLWETMAKNQLEEKNRAELENAALKRKMEAQLKFAKSLERMLRKRRVSPPLQLCVFRVPGCAQLMCVACLDLGRSPGAHATALHDHVRQGFGCLRIAHEQHRGPHTDRGRRVCCPGTHGAIAAEARHEHRIR